MRIRLFVLFLITAICTLAKAQSASDGNDFYLGLLFPSYNTVTTYSNKYSVLALVSSLEDNTVSVSYFDPESGVEEAPTTYKVTALNSISIPLNIQKMMMSQSEVSEYRSVHIRGKKKISVQYFSSGASSGGAYLSLPSNVLGRKYVVASYNDNPDGVGALIGGEAPSTYDIGCGEFVVIATENGTNVTITMRSESAGGIKAGESRTVALNRGECYLVRSKCSSNDADISGSIVESDHPVAVISGHSNASLGNVGDHVVESRDFMIEQMIPVEYWDTTGYTGIPFVNTSPHTADGAGDSYRVYSYDTSANTVKMNGTIDMTSSRLNPREKFDVEAAASFSSTNKKPFMVVQYDQASQGDKDPHPRPSMMQLIPQSRCRKMYRLTVPAKTFERSQSDYLWISPEPSSFVSVSRNGGEPVPFSQAGFQKIVTSSTAPGKVYKVSPGSYVITNEYPYANMLIYQYGFRMMSADVSAGDEDGDDSYTSYAMPAGIQLPTIDTSKFIVKIDTICNGWNICVSRLGIEDSISSVELLYEPNGQYNFEYSNIAFDSAGLLLKSPKLSFDGKKSTVCFSLKRKYNSYDASASVLIANDKGRTLMLDLGYRANVSYHYYNNASFNGSDYGSKSIGYENDTVIVVDNSSYSTVDHVVRSVTLKESNPSFEIVNVSEQLPARLKPAQSLRITLRTRCLDTGLSVSSLAFEGNCGTSEFPVSIRGIEGILSVPDVTFGDLKVLHKNSGQKIQVKNIGTAKFKLTNLVSITDTVNFIVDTNTLKYNGTSARLPLEIIPGSYATMDVGFYPKSHGYKLCTITWATNINSKYDPDGKTTSTISGTALRYGVYWEKDELRFRSDENGPLRIDLVNAYDSLTRVKAVRISGSDSAEFNISNSESTLENFSLTANDRDWYSIEFTPDISKSLSDKYKTRSARLEAVIGDSIVSIPLSGDVSKLNIENSTKEERFSLENRLSLTHNDEIICTLASPAHLSYSVFTILGQEIATKPFSYYGAGKHILELPLSKLNTASYMLRVTDGVYTKSISFRVVK